MQRGRIARASLLVATAFAWMVAGSAAAHAQTIPTNSVVTQGAMSAMLDTLRSHKHLDVQTAPASGGSEGVPPPISDSDQTKAAFLLPAIDYQAKIGTNFATGPTGSIRHALQGSVDGGVIIRLEPRTRIALAYYQLSTNEIGVDQGTIPIEIQGQGVLTQENLQAFQPDPSNKLEVYVFAVERLFTIKNDPLVATFAYDSQDSLTFGARNPVLSYLDGNVQNLFIRTEQHYNLIISEPFVLNDQKLFVLFNEQLQQLVHTTGFNAAPNRPQFLYSAFFQYDINEKTSFFFEPAHNVVYFPTDRYQQHETIFLYGLTYKLRKPFFFQASVTMVTPTNPDFDGTGRIGITRVTIACPPNPGGAPGISPACAQNLQSQVTTPTFGGTKVETINLSLGIGTPPVFIPF